MKKNIFIIGFNHDGILIWNIKINYIKLIFMKVEMQLLIKDHLNIVWKWENYQVKLLNQDYHFLMIVNMKKHFGLLLLYLRKDMLVINMNLILINLNKILWVLYLNEEIMLQLLKKFVEVLLINLLIIEVRKVLKIILINVYKICLIINTILNTF